MILQTSTTSAGVTSSPCRWLLLMYLLHYVDAVFQFSNIMSNLTTSEEAGSVEVCVQLLSGTLSTSVEITLSAISGTALGTDWFTLF